MRGRFEVGCVRSWFCQSLVHRFTLTMEEEVDEIEGQWLQDTNGDGIGCGRVGALRRVHSRIPAAFLDTSTPRTNSTTTVILSHNASLSISIAHQKTKQLSSSFFFLLSLILFLNPFANSCFHPPASLYSLNPQVPHSSFSSSQVSSLPALPPPPQR